MTREQLAHYSGRDGKPAYVAVGGIIYDVSTSPLWENGTHEGVHQAGCDLTNELKTAPHVAAVVERFPSVGRLENSPEPKLSLKLRLILLGGMLLMIALVLILLR